MIQRVTLSNAGGDERANTRFGVTVRALLRTLLLLMTITAFALVGMPPRRAQGTLPGGCRTISFGAGNDVGASTGSTWLWP